MKSFENSHFRLPENLIDKCSDQMKTGMPSYFQKRNRVFSIQHSEQLQRARYMANKIGKLFEEFQNHISEIPALEIKANHRTITGWLQSNSKSTSFKSLLEQDFTYLTLFDPRVVSIHYQPVTITFLGTNNQNRRYTPDYLVTIDNQSENKLSCLVEVKTEADLLVSDPSRDERFAAANRWAEEHGMKFHVVSEKEIRGPHLDTVKALYPFRFGVTEDDESISWEILDFIKTHSTTTIEDILNDNSKRLDGRNNVQRSIWILFARQMIFSDFSATLTTTSRVTSTPIWDGPASLFK